MSPAEKKQIEKNTEEMVKKSCCPKDFLMMVLTSLEECFQISSWEFNIDPYVACRKELFQKDGPCNDERRSKCSDKKTSWMTCIDTVTKKEKLGLKPKYQNNDTLLREIPREKLLCFQRALEEINCS